ncbi:MAG: 2'-deoxycytidine 5'-triphosphate deaminase [Kiloniellales bacterium]|nr:2'-deoxycytidine 5'-triphosphate deaminase [Kiloniellales bacterium]
MTSALAHRDLFPQDEDFARKSGIFPAQWYEMAVQRKIITSLTPITEAQIQPASIDLRLGKTAYRVPASFLPGPNCRVREKVEALALEKIDLTEGAELKRNQVYLVELQECIDLRKRMSGLANPKSSTGRLDIFARVITDYASEFDSIKERYRGPLWVEIAPRSFHGIVRTGSRLVQLRIKLGMPRPSERLHRDLHQENQVVMGEDDVDIRQRGISFSVDAEGDSISGLIGYKARKTDLSVDVDKINHYDRNDFWEPVIRPKSGGIILRPDEFHILASKETITVPEDYAADMIAYDTLVGEFRVHYAGFFDPGFGYSASGQRYAKAVLEVRSHEVPFFMEDGQIVGRLAFERLTEKTNKPYGQSGMGSSYQFQGLALSKHFKR